LSDGTASRATILIVEEDADVREALRDILVSEGYATVCAADGEQGLASLREGAPPAAVILDLLKVRMTATQFIARMRASLAAAKVPVLLVSANPRIAQIAAEIGAEGYLLKPMKVEELLDAVARLAARPSG
jgi:CheY-like chemotaxis protein